MNALLQKEDRLVTVICPKDHIMRKKIKLTTLWKKYGLRFQNSQVVYEGYDYSEMKSFFNKHGVSTSQLKTTKLDSQNGLKLPTYQLSPQQTKWCSKKCTVCNPPSQ